MTQHATHGGHGGGGHGGGGHGGHDSVGKYIAVFIALCVLTTASFATYFDFWRSHMPPQVGWAFMMAVSCTKAMLVILFFMHVKYEANWKYVLTVPPAIMSVFLMLALVPDIGLRDKWVSEERQLHMADPEVFGDLGHAAHPVSAPSAAGAPHHP